MKMRCQWFIILAFSSQAMAMEMFRSDVQVINETSENIIVDFQDPVKLSDFSESRIAADNNPRLAIDHAIIDANKTSRFSRSLKPAGRLDIKNFAQGQTLSAERNKEIVSFTKELISKLSQPGTKIIRLITKTAPTKTGALIGSAKEFLPTSYMPKKLTSWMPSSPVTLEEKTLAFTIDADPRSLAALEELEKGIVTQRSPIAKSLEKEMTREQIEVKETEQEEKTYNYMKKEKLKQAQGIGTWGEVLKLIYDDTVPTLTEEKVFQKLGFKDITPTRSQLLNPSLAGMPADASPRAVFKKLGPIFGEDKHLSDIKYFGPALQVKDKSHIVYRILVEALSKAS